MNKLATWGCGIIVAVTTTMTIAEDVEETPEEVCVPWADYVNYANYLEGLEQRVRDSYVFYIEEQKKQAEQSYRKEKGYEQVSSNVE